MGANFRPNHVDHHVPIAAMDALNRPSSRAVHYDSDPDLDMFCVACTPEYRGGAWQHDLSCIARTQAT